MACFEIIYSVVSMYIKNCLFFFRIFLLSFFFLYSKANGQGLGDSVRLTNLTVSYAIKIEGKNKSGVKETYNGGTKTVFAGGDKARIRQASLMRIQSIFLLPAIRGRENAVITKESGADKYNVKLTAKEWELYNEKYKNAQCSLTADSLILSGYQCRKAIVTLADGRSIIVYYTTELVNPVFSAADPAFWQVPGIVLQYSYHTKGNSITYTANDISDKKILPSVFRIPVTGYKNKRYVHGKAPEDVKDLLLEEPDEEQ